MMIKLTGLALMRSEPIGTPPRENPVLVNLDRVCVIGAAPDGRTIVMFDGGLLPVKETLEEIAAMVLP